MNTQQIPTSQELEDCYMKTSARILHYLMANGVDSYSAEDILHDSFILLWKDQQKLLSINVAPAYWFTIVRHKMADHFTAKHRNRPDTELNNYASTAPSHAEVMDRRYLRFRLIDAVKKLPIEMRKPYVLAKISGVSIMAISLLPGNTESLVKTRIHRAKKRLKLLLEDLKDQ